MALKLDCSFPFDVSRVKRQIFTLRKESDNELMIANIFNVYLCLSLVLMFMSFASVDFAENA